MKTNEIIENNKLLAEFLELLTKDNEGNIKEDINLFNFHTDWNWLMLVVEKIERLGFGVTIYKKGCHINDINAYINGFNHKSKIYQTYKACVGFIKWYNSQPSQIGFDENGDNVITK